MAAGRSVPRRPAARLLALAAALGLAACATTRSYSAGKGELLLTVDNGGRAIAGEARPAAAESLTELRWLGLAGDQAIFMRTEQDVDALTVPETGERLRIRPRDSTSFVVDVGEQREIELRGYRIRIESIDPERIEFAIDAPS
jgi:hypothetical protein